MRFEVEPTRVEFAAVRADGAAGSAVAEPVAMREESPLTSTLSRASGGEGAKGVVSDTDTAAVASPSAPLAREKVGLKETNAGGHPDATTSTTASNPFAVAPTATADSAPAAKLIASGATVAPSTKPITGTATPPAFSSAPRADAGSVGGTVLALVLVVGLILLLGWLARRMPGIGRASNDSLRVVASLALGPRERVVVVEVGTTQLLLGVGQSGIRKLHALAQPLPAAAPAATSPFAQLLAQQFGKKA